MNRVWIVGGGVLFVIAVAIVGFWAWSSNDMPRESLMTGDVSEVIDSADRQSEIKKEEQRAASFPSDKDGDGLSDDEEARRKTDPGSVDTDKDGFQDAYEIFLAKTDPLKADARDFGRAAPVKVAATSSNILSVDAGQDEDSDGLTDVQERALKTNVQSADTDGDGISDGEEVNEYKTDPTKKDSDGDGYEDAVEIKGGYNPRGAGSCLNPGCLP